MGKKITVFATSSPLIEAPVNKVKEATLYAVLKGQSISQTIVEDAILGGMSVHADRAYRYGYEHYSLGLPAGTMSSILQVPNTIVEGILEPVLGQEVAVSYNVIDTLTIDHVVEEFLLNSRGYDPGTYIVSTHPFAASAEYPVTLDDTEYVQETHQVKLTYKNEYIVDVDNEGNIITGFQYFEEYYDIPASLSIGAQYCIALYQLREEGSRKLLPGHYYWFYRLADGTYPILNRAVIEFDKTGFFPIVPVRRHNVDLTAGANRDTSLFITSKKLLKYLNLDIDQLAEKLNENPDIADIDHAYVMLGIDIQTQVPESILYLVMFFDYIAGAARYKKATFDSGVAGLTPMARNNLSTVFNRIKTPSDISFQEMDINFDIDFNYIESTWENGSIGPKGTVTSATYTAPPLSIKQYTDANTDSGNLQVSYVTVPNDYIIFCWQVTDTSYKQIKVHGLVHTNHVYSSKTVVTDLSESLDPDNNNFIIPVHYGIARMMPLLKRNIMYQDALRLQINSYVITKVKWYEHSFFKFLVFAVSIIVTVVTAGGSSGWTAGLIAAAKAGTAVLLQLLLEKLIMALLLSTILKYAMKYVAKALGAEWAAIIGAVVAIYAIASGPKGNLPIGTVANIPTSQALLSVGQALIKASQDILGEAFNDLRSALVEWNDQVATQDKELERAMELLNNDPLISPLDWVASPRIMQVPHESPDAFYNRTIHTGNPGALTLDVIGQFYDNMLMLPKPNSLIIT